jgi:transcriptional regulator with XRE-family HTH domain
MKTLETLASRYPSAAQLAAALGISRQALSQARQRGRLSEAVTLRAAALLNIDPGAALLENATAKPPPAPISHPAPPFPAVLPEKADFLHYVKRPQHKKTDEGETAKNIHSIASPDQENALDIVKWCYGLAHIPADSPRFAYYVSRWNVPEKVARARQAGTLHALLLQCPPIDPDWLRLVPAALEEWRRFTRQTRPPTAKQARSSGKTRRAA